MEEDYKNNGYDVSAQIVFYIYCIVIPLSILGVLVENTDLLLAIILLIILGVLVSYFLKVLRLLKQRERFIKSISYTPRTKFRIFRFFIPKREQEEILGDLLEIKEFLKEREYSKNGIRFILFINLLNIIFIQIKSFIYGLFTWEKGKEIDQ